MIERVNLIPRGKTRWHESTLLISQLFEWTKPAVGLVSDRAWPMSGPPKCFTLEGLGDDLECDEEIRGRALAIGGLLKWPKPELAGTITTQTLSDIADVVLHVLKIWVPQLTDKLKTVTIPMVEPEAR